MVVGGRSYWVPCNECQRVIGWIMFSLYDLFLPGTCIAIPYGYTGYELCTYVCIRVYVRRVPTAPKV